MALVIPWKLFTLYFFPSSAGQRLKARDVVFAGIATHFIPRSQVSDLTPETKTYVVPKQGAQHGLEKRRLVSFVKVPLHVFFFFYLLIARCILDIYSEGAAWWSMFG